MTTQLSKNEQTKHSPLETKPRKVVMLQDSPLSQEKLGKIKNSRTIDGRHTSLHALEQAPPSIGHLKKTYSSCAVEIIIIIMFVYYNK